MEFGGTLILPSDVLIVPVASLSSTVRRQIQAEADDFAISRPSTRSRSRVINAAAAELLQQFREPRTIVEAILRYSQAKGLDPKNVLEYAFPLLRPLLAERLLTPSDSSEARRIEPTFPAGATLAGCLINCCVQTMEDTEVYRAIAPKGESVAIKIVRPNARAEVTTRLEMEDRILTHLDGTVSPVLRGRGAEAGRPFLLLEWCHGTDAAAAAARLRQTGSEADAVALLRLGGAILRAFSSLHDQGVIHGDIHPKNVLISSDGRAKVIDFGFAHLSTTNATFRDPTRGDVGYYFEPEYAHACLRNEEPPPATEVGEQYALAALLYYLFAGEHYLSFSLGREDFLRQIAAETPLSFSERGLTHWPDLERILSRALHKDPAARFASLRNFAEEWETVALPFSGARLPSARAAGGTLLESFLQRIGTSGDLLFRELNAPSTCSVNYGAAGIAYALYRIACIRGDPSVLSAADLWATRAWQDHDKPNAFVSPEFDLTERIVDPMSLYHRVSGVHCIRALVSHALGNFSATKEAIKEFVASSQASGRKLDLTTGRASTLIGCSALLEALPNYSWTEKALLQDLGDDVLCELWNQLEACPPIGESRTCSWLGVAHGWAGFLYATMRWCMTAGRSLPAATKVRLLELAGQAQSIGGGLGWLLSTDQTTQRPWVGWCHGSAGYVHLWLLAHQSYQEKEFLRLAEGAASYSWQEPGTSCSLCCGHAGRAYALLAIWKHTGDRVWLYRARKQAELAFAGAASSGLIKNSLYKGDVGIALLAADLTRPEGACMPLFEPEGWPIDKRS